MNLTQGQNLGWPGLNVMFIIFQSAGLSFELRMVCLQLILRAFTPDHPGC